MSMMPLSKTCPEVLEIPRHVTDRRWNTMTNGEVTCSMDSYDLHLAADLYPKAVKVYLVPGMQLETVEEECVLGLRVYKAIYKGKTYTVKFMYTFLMNLTPAN